MTIASILPIFIWVPIIGFFVSNILPKTNERLISGTAFGALVVQLSLATAYVLYWVFNGAETLQVKEIILFQNADYIFQIDFLFDWITAVYLLVGAVLTLLVTRSARS